MNGWNTTALGEIANIICGGTPSTSVSEYWNPPEIDWVTAKDISDTSAAKLYDTERRISKKGLDNSSARILPALTTVLIARGATMGKCRLLGKDMALNQTCYGIIAKNGTDPIYLYYYFSNLYDHLRAMSHGSVFDTVIGSGLRSLPITIPSLLTQRRIAEILGRLDNKIEVNRRINRTLEVMAQALFKHWFVDFGPFQDGPFVESELGLIPEGWRIVPFKDTIDFLEGPGIRNWQYTNSLEGTRFINIRCIQDRDLDLSTANRVKDEEAYGKYKHFLLQADDIIVSTSGTLGRFAIIREEHLPLMLNTSVIRMRPIQGITTKDFVWGVIESQRFQQELELQASGSAQQNFGPIHLKKMMLLLPPYRILMDYSSQVLPLYRKMLNNLTENSRLAATRDYLLPKLLSGEITV